MSPPAAELAAIQAPPRALSKVLVATVAAQAVIVMASLTVPVLTSVIAPAAGLPPYLVGYYSALLYGIAALSSLATPDMLRRWGGIRLHQIMLVLAAVALLLLLPAAPAGFALGAVALGIAYGPMNPASTVLLARYTPAQLRARVFSLKQTAVPAGGAMAGLITPVAAAAFGWRGATAAIAATCVVLALAIQPWRDQLDGDRRPGAAVGWRNLWLPLRVLFATARLREVAFASLAFGALQFSFSAVFPTVLTENGWAVRDAGKVLSAALIVGVVCRVPWGGVADRIGARPILAAMGLMMSLAALATAFLTPAWSGGAVAALAALFGLSAFCWPGVGIAELVREAPPGLVSEASAGMIALIFVGALAGPALFSSAALVAGNFRPAFLVLALLAAVPSLLLCRRPG